MASPKIALYGGSFNPPHYGHISVVEGLIKYFDQIFIIPSGGRPDKNPAQQIFPPFRKKMCELAFGNFDKVKFDFSDIENPLFTCTFDLNKRYEDLQIGEVWHVVGSDLVIGGVNGSSQIQKNWIKGNSIWQRINFAVMERGGFPITETDIPPHAMIIRVPLSSISSSEIRQRIGKNHSILGMVPQDIAKFIREHHIYG